MDSYMESKEVVTVAPPKEPPHIRRLNESMVNRIAADEVIQCPVSIVKQLVENSLDAGSTSIIVIVKDGDLKLIYVSDDGHVRGLVNTVREAYHVKAVRVLGPTWHMSWLLPSRKASCMVIVSGRVSYRDGVMENQPKACAAVKGTLIMVENLFYNMTARKD